MSDRQRSLLMLFAVVILLIPLFFLNIKSFHEWGDDFAQYILQAKNLAEGKPQNTNAYIFNPDYPIYAPPLYSSGYPILLAPVYALFGNDLVAFNYFQTWLLFLFGISMFYFFKGFVDFLTALLLMLVAVYNPWLIDFKTKILADLPFSLFVLLSVISYMNFKVTGNLSSAVLTGCLIGFSILIKPLGLFLIPAFLIEPVLTYFKSKSFKEPLSWKLLLVFFLPLLMYVVMNYFIIPSPETLGHFSGLYRWEHLNKRFDANATYYMNLFQDLFSNTNPGWNFLMVVLRVFILSLFLIGFFGKIFSRLGLIEWVTLLFLPFVLFFPSISQGFRYLLSLLPMMLLYVYHGYESIRLSPKLNRKYVFLIACFVCLFQYKSAIEKIWKHRQDVAQWGPQQATAKEAFFYIQQHTEPEVVVAFDKPRALALYTQRKALTNDPEQDIGSMKNFFEKNQVGYYLICSELSNPRLDFFLKEEASSLNPVWANEEFTLYRKMN